MKQHNQIARQILALIKEHGSLHPLDKVIPKIEIILEQEYGTRIQSYSDEQEYLKNAFPNLKKDKENGR